MNVVKDGHAVSRVADYTIYSVEAEYIDAVVAQYGPCECVGICSLLLASFFPLTGISTSATKIGAVVGGQTSVKAPERAAFEKYLPADVDIVSCHSLHGPTVSPEGEPLVSHRSTRVNWTSLMLS